MSGSVLMGSTLRARTAMMAVVWVIAAYNLHADVIRSGPGPTAGQVGAHEFHAEPSSAAPGGDIVLVRDGGVVFKRDVSKVTFNYAEVGQAERGFGTVEADVTDASRIALHLPKDAACGTYEIIVSTEGSSARQVLSAQGRAAFAIIAPCTEPPKITGLTPGRATPGSVITIKGEGFGFKSVVNVGAGYHDWDAASRGAQRRSRSFCPRRSPGQRSGVVTTLPCPFGILPSNQRAASSVSTSPAIRPRSTS